jgi:predicted alpha/beta-fold hydrolase
MIIKSNFVPLWWLRNPHLQTIYPHFLSTAHQKLKITKERIELKDGDFINLFWSQENLSSKHPLAIVLHGLGGGIHSHYVNHIFSSFNTAGIRCVLMHFRGAGDEPNRFLRTYHAGETNDFNEILQLLSNREADQLKYAIGVSLGGNVLLKWLGEQGQQSLIEKAIAISVPFKLNIAVNTMKRGLSRIYQNFMLNSLRNMHFKKMDLVEYPLSKTSILNLKNFWDYDNLITAPVFGFKNAEHYYAESSSISYLSSIKTTTLIIHAKDDPLMTPSVIPNVKHLSKDILFELSDNGGHVGFIQQDENHQISYWWKKRMLSFLQN